MNGPHRIGRTIQLCLFALACLTLPSNIHLGLRFGEGRRASLKPVERGLKRHLPGTELVARFGDRLNNIDKNTLYFYMCELKRGRIGTFRSFCEDLAPTRGALDGVVLESRGLRLSVWAAGLGTGPVDGFKVTCGQKVFTEFETARAPSPDVAAVFPELDGVGNCRFHIRIPLTELDRAEVRGSTIICTPLVGGREGIDIPFRSGKLVEESVAEVPNLSKTTR